MIIIIGISFFYKYSLDSINRDQETYEDFKFRSSLSSIPSISELKCSTLGEQKECIDLEKAKAFRSISKEYNSIFGYKNITLYVVYPLGDQSGVILYYNRLPRYKSLLRISSPVLVYDSFDSSYKVGLLVAERYR